MCGVQKIQVAYEENYRIQYATADKGKTLLIVHVTAPWVQKYDEILQRIEKIADEVGANKMAIFFTRKATEYFLKKKGWKTVDKEKGIMEYVRRR